MKLISKLLVIFAALTFFGGASSVHADAKSDYEFQYSKYRQNYIEYSILKKDYLENPSLDNQQKAVLSAKQTISSRDLAKASYAAYLLDLCQENKTNYAPISRALDSLKAAKQFFLSEAEKSRGVVTPAQLAIFSSEYDTNTVIHDQSFMTGVVACKISNLVRLQVESKNALDIILPKLATPFSTSLKTRIEDLQILGNNINENINNFSEKLYSEEMQNNLNNETFFTDSAEILKKIRTQQLKWINGLIDIDINYAHS